MVSKAKLAEHPGAVARTKEHFTAPEGSGWMLFDYDAPKEGAALASPEALMAEVAKAWPAVVGAPAVGYYSSSSFIEDTRAGKAVTGIAGMHLWVQIADASDMPRAGEVLHQRLWLAGMGHIEVSKAGSLLERALLDQAVHSPERLVFAAEPVCRDGYERLNPGLVIINSDAAPVDTRSTLTVTAAESERYREAVALAKKRQDVTSAAVAQREQWAKERVAADHPDAATEVRANMARSYLHSLASGALAADLLVTLADGERVSVADLLLHREQYDGAEMHDPLTPDEDSRVAFVRLLGCQQPFIYSHKHGGQKFYLQPKRKRFELTEDDPYALHSAIATHLLADAGVVIHGGILKALEPTGKLRRIDKECMATLIDRHCSLVKCKADGTWPPKGASSELGTKVLQVMHTMDVPTLNAVHKHPTVAPSGQLLATPGLNHAERLFYVAEGEEAPVVPELSTDEQLAEMWAKVWLPVKAFPFVSNADRTMAALMIFTAICRPTLPTAPAFLIRAHTPGTGKSLFCTTVAAMVGHEVSANGVNPEDKAEFGKRLDAATGRSSPVVMFDNLKGQLDHESLNRLLTAPTYSYRPLGSSAEVAAIVRKLWLFNGNNVYTVDDSCRRILPISMDSGEEAPEKRVFKLDPVAYGKERRVELQVALCSLLMAYCRTAEFKKPMPSGDFSEWSKLVEGCVMWLGSCGALGFEAVDRHEVIAENKADDAGRVAFTTFLECVHKVYADKPFEAGKLGQAANGSFDAQLDHTATMELHDAARELAPAGQHGYNSKGLGKLLATKVGAPHRGYVLRSQKRSGRAARYWVEQKA